MLKPQEQRQNTRALPVKTTIWTLSLVSTARTLSIHTSHCYVPVMSNPSPSKNRQTMALPWRKYPFRNADICHLDAHNYVLDQMTKIRRIGGVYPPTRVKKKMKTVLMNCQQPRDRKFWSFTNPVAISTRILLNWDRCWEIFYWVIVVLAHKTVENVGFTRPVRKPLTRSCDRDRRCRGKLAI